MNTTKVKPNKLQTPVEELDELIRIALEEDIGGGDVTTDRIVTKSEKSSACWKAKEKGIAAGLYVGEKVFNTLDKEIRWEPQIEEGARVKSGDILVEMEGQSRALLTGERTALNFVQRISGIATATRRFTNILDGTNTKILDTRKTLPGFRALDKYAVKTGGGENHRMGLFDIALIKENHITVAGGIMQAVEAVRNGQPEVKIEVETTNFAEVKEAVAAGADMIMLDNMSIYEMQKSVDYIKGRAKTEASGNVTIESVKEIAAAGVDYISVGTLTHSVTAFDISQLIKK